MVDSLMLESKNIMAAQWLGNSLRDYTVFLISVSLGLVAVKIFERIVVRTLKKWSRKTDTTFDDFLVSLIEKNALPVFYVLVLQFSLRGLNVKPMIHHAASILVTITITFLGIRSVMAGVHYALQQFWLSQDKENDLSHAKNLNGIITTIKIIVWIIGGILLLDNLGVKVSAFVAGMGITGIAVALAAQTLLGDLFSHFVIFFDRPFVVGDTIKVDAFIGEVEHIGLKTTRVRSMSGEEIIFSNKNLTDSRVQNFKRLQKRRALFTFGLTYDTPLSALKEMPKLIQAVIENIADTNFDRAHFTGFGDSSLNFEVVYFVTVPAYNRFMDIQQEINLILIEECNTRGIKFAYPTRTIYVTGGNFALPKV